MLEKIYLFQVSESSIFRVFEYQNFRIQEERKGPRIPAQASPQESGKPNFNRSMHLLPLLCSVRNSTVTFRPIDKIIRIRIISNMKSLLNKELEYIKKIDIQKNIEEIDNII